MYVSLPKLLVLAAAAVALFAASAVSQDVGTPIWSAGYGSDANGYAVAVDPATGDSYTAINFFGKPKPASQSFSSYPCAEEA